MDRRGLAAVDAVAATTRILSPWECAGLDLRFDPTLAGPKDLRQAGPDAQQTFSAIAQDPPPFLWGAGPKRVSATAMVALERGLALGELTPEQEDHLKVEGQARDMVWDRASELYLPVHVYLDVRQQIHERPLESFVEDYRHRSFLVGPDGRTPLREAIDAAIEHPRSWISVPEMPAPDEPEPGDLAAALRQQLEEDWGPDDYVPILPRRAPGKPAVAAPVVPQEAPEAPAPPSLAPEPDPPSPAPTRRPKVRR